MVSFLHHRLMVPAAIAIVATTTSVTAFTATTTTPQQTRISKTVVHATKSNNESSTRRDVINKVFTASLLTITSLASSSVSYSPPSNALDIDSFENSLLEQDTTQCNPKLDPKCIPKLTPDEALCKYGVPGADARTDACKRVRDAGGQLPTSKAGERSTQGWLNGDIALTR